MEWYLEVLKKYATFKGRARRTEFWTFTLINCVISFALSFLRFMIQDGLREFGFINIIASLFALSILIPAIAVTVRRLHDTGKSGWWYFIFLVPIIGWFLLLVFLVTDSEPGENQYGPNPKGVTAAAKQSEPASGRTSTFTIWVKDENPNEMFLLALLMRIKAEHPEKMPADIKDMLDDKIPHDLQYRTTRNYAEGRTYVDFIFTRR